VSNRSLRVGLEIGASARGVLPLLGGVRRTLAGLGDTASKLTRQHAELGASIQRNLGTLAPSTVAALNRDYVRLGQTLDTVRRKQEQLTARLARRDQLRDQRAELRSGVLETVAIGASAALPVKLAIDYESALADVKKVVDFDTPDGFAKLGDELLRMTRTLPLAASELAAIAASGGQLGVAAADIPKFTETVAKMSTAFDMGAEEAGDSMAKLANVYQIPISQIGRIGDAINHLSNASPAKARDIVQGLNRVGGVAKQFGLVETQAAALVNAFVSLGKPPEVAGTAINGMLAKLATADKQPKKFQRALQEMGMTAEGLKASIGKDAQGTLTSFLNTISKVPKADQMGVLVDLFGLEYADDVAVLAGSMDTYAKSLALVNKASNYEGSMEKEFQARSETTENNLRLLKNSMVELGVNVGAALLPSLNSLVDTLKPMIWGFSTWAKENPEVVSGVIKLVAGAVALKLGVVGLSYGLSLGASGLNGVGIAISLLSGKFTMMRAMLLLGGRLGPFITGLSLLRGGAMRLAPALGMARTAVLWLGRALLMNPIGLLITGIALGAYLIYRYWEPIKGFFGGLWTEIKAGFSGGLTGILGLLINFSPLGLFYRAFAGVMNYFGIELPGKFSEFGGMLVTGLVNGITSMAGSLKDTVVGMGSSIKGWFTGEVEINSPSRVFMGYGANLSEGAAIGITGSEGLVRKAALGMAAATAVSLATPQLAAAEGPAATASRVANLARSVGPAALSGQAGGGITIHYSPTVTVQGGGPGTQEAVQQALQLSRNDLEKLMREVIADQQRRAF
jgi:TP901 family phage tail tape measure protein